MHADCNERKLVIANVRIRRKSGDSPDCLERIKPFGIFWLLSLHVTWQNITSPQFNSIWDFAPCDFHLFAKLKLPLKRRFQTVDEIMGNVMIITQEEFADCFENWKKMLR